MNINTDIMLTLNKKKKKKKKNPMYPTEITKSLLQGFLARRAVDDRKSPVFKNRTYKTF